ncbi:MAG: hypothetical protein AB7E85_05840 [Pseudobdellovibrionaceae bacterium]
MKSQDIILILKFIQLEQQISYDEIPYWQSDSPYAVRNLAGELGISKSEISASIQRSISSGLAIRTRSDTAILIPHNEFFKFIIYGLKYAFPVKPGAIKRGIPTAHSAPVFKEKLLSGGEDKYVWPHALGQEKGEAIEPLFKSVPETALKNQFLYDCLALIDAIRVGKQRETAVAKDLLAERIFPQ